ncbi:hypothetical protein [Myceligenerans halotolerans]
MDQIGAVLIRQADQFGSFSQRVPRRLWPSCDDDVDSVLAAEAVELSRQP